MCGIVGMVGVSDKELLEKMMGTLIHRGPDGAGALVKRSVAMGMRRLAIIDLNSGDQPVFNEDRTVSVIFNGEIYNFKELRNSLVKRGHAFRSQSDTETIVHLYEEYGEDCVLHLQGMFAFAIWDSKKERLILARDRLGIKPLYLRQVQDKLFFASELKALLADPRCPREMDWYALHLYLSLLYVPAPQTIFQGITKLLPGHLLIWQKGKTEIRRYWSVSFEKRKRPVPEMEEELLELLKSTVKQHLISDVPLGVFLSGGMDSGSLVALMSQVSAAPIKSFSIGYGPAYASYDELKRTRLVARHFGCDHHEFLLEPHVVDLLPKLVEQFDEPFADSSAIPTYLISQATRRQVTTVLAGIGGDELFGGYPRYLGAKLSLAYQHLPKTLRRILARSAQELKESPESRNLAGWIKRFTRGGLLPLGERYASWMSFFTEEDRQGLYSPDFRAWIQQSSGTNPLILCFEKAQGLEALDQIFSVDLATYLPDDLLTMGDRMSMAHSLEMRVPYCDHRLVEFSAGLPASVKIQKFRLKALFKDTMKSILPLQTIEGPKQGFMLPLAQWLQKDLVPLMDDLLHPDTVRKRGYFKPAYVQFMRQQHQQHKRLFTDQLWTLLNLELWQRLFMDKTKSLDRPSRPRLEVSASAVQIPQTSRRPLNILLTTDIHFTEQEGGSSRVAQEIVQGLCRRGHRLTVVTRQFQGAPLQESQQGATIYRYPFAANGGGWKEMWTAWTSYRQTLQNILSRESFDIVIMNSPFAAYGVLRHKQAKNLPALYMFYGPWHEEYRVRQKSYLNKDLWKRFLAGPLQIQLRKMVEKKALGQAKKIFLLSHFSQEQLSRLHDIDKSQTIIVPAGVDSRHFDWPQSRAQARKTLGLAKAHPVLFCVRNLVPRMGLENLLIASKILLQNTPELLLILGGQGPLQENLEWLVREMGLEKHVRLEGFIPEEKLPLYYQAADLSVLPTKSLEGFGLVILESLACGTPVIGTPVGAIREVLGKLDPELVCDEIHAPALVRGVQAFLSKSFQEQEALRMRCRSFAQENFSWDRMVQQIEQGLFEILEINK